MDDSPGQGITAMQMVNEVRKRQSSKKLFSDDLKGQRKVPQRAQSFKYGP